MVWGYGKCLGWVRVRVGFRVRVCIGLGKGDGWVRVRIRVG